jgi:hypothetical protein
VSVSQVKGPHVLIAGEGCGAHARRSFELSSAAFRGAGPPCREALPSADFEVELEEAVGGAGPRFCIEL